MGTNLDTVATTNHALTNTDMTPSGQVETNPDTGAATDRAPISLNAAATAAADMQTAPDAETQDVMPKGMVLGGNDTQSTRDDDHGTFPLRFRIKVSIHLDLIFSSAYRDGNIASR